jgi:hypothetical protein
MNINEMRIIKEMRMTARLRALVTAVAADGYRGDWHQKLFYAMNKDLRDLAVISSTARGSIAVLKILALQEEYAAVEEMLMRESLKRDK